MTLKEYQKKRNFKKTKEPSGSDDKPKTKKTKSIKDPIFVVQEHAATNLHYDFRLEVESLLISWAVPKGPSLDPQVKRLAVHVEDHPLDYSNFEGKIPEGEYGAGNVIVWDTGTWELLTSHDFQYDMKKGKLTFMLIGKKLHGVWSLIRLKNQRKNWLLFKHQDKYAISGTKGEITAYKTKSVLSNKEIKLSHGEK